MRTLADKLRSLASDAEAMAETLDSRGRDRPLAVDVLRNVIPAARLYASKSKDGPWWSYVTMPLGWKPRPQDKWWILNNGNPESYYWNTYSGETKEECLKKALSALIEIGLG